MKSLQEWRTEKMLSQRALAEMMGLKRHATIADIEAGRRVPRFGTMRAISAALGVDVRDVTEFADALEVKAQKRPQDES